MSKLVVITKGLASGDEVITDVPATLTDGAQVTVRSAGSEGAKGEGKRKGDKSKEDSSNKEPAKEAAGKESKS